MSTFSLRRIARSVTPAAKRSSLLSVAKRTALAEATGLGAGRAGQPLLGMVTAAASIYVLGSLLSASAWAAPAGGTVVAGSASIVQATPDTLNIVQGSNKAIVNWQSFSIGAGETVNFQQPTSKSVTLNRVTGNDPSAIYGILNANGTVMLVNPNGVVFGPSSRVDVGGLVASTANISDADFMAGNYRFAEASGNKNARIVNQGDISIRDAGLAALVAPGVENSGVIKAKLGKVALAGAETFTLDFQGDGLLSFDASSVVSQAPQDAEGKALVINSGSISADGGSIELSARAVKGVIDNVINTNGVVAANSIGSRNGKIVLSGGDNGGVAIAGTLSATGSAEAEVGGRVIATGSAISVAENTLIDASGNAGGGQIAIGNDGTASGAWSRESVTVAESATLKADALKKGDGGRVTVLADKTTRFAGKISAKGGAEGGDGGFAEVSSRDTIVLAGNVDLSAAKGKTGDLLIDPATLRITDNSSTSGGGTGNEVTRGWLEGQAPTANITLEADGLITIDAMASNLIDLKTGTGNSFTLRSLKSDGIVFADANTEIRTQGGSINLEALGVGATLSNIGKLTSNGGTVTLLANSSISLANTIDAGSTGNVVVQSVAGSINRAAGAIDPTLHGGSVSLSATIGNIGTQMDAINTATGALKLETGGHLNVANAGTLDSLAITSKHILPNGTNTYALTSDGLTFDVADGASYHLNEISQAGLALQFSGDRDLTLGTLDVGSGTLQLTSTNGSLRAGDDNLLRAASLKLSATGAIGADGRPLTTDVPVIEASALGGGLFLDNDGALNLSALANGNVAVATSGDLIVKSLTATNRDVSLNASNGNIATDSSVNGGVLLDARSLNLTSSGAIGTAGNRLLSNATTFIADAGLGGVYADLNGASATLNVTSGNGAIDLTTQNSTTASLVSSTDDPANTIKLVVAKGGLTLGDVDAKTLADVLLELLGSGAVNSTSGTRVSGRRLILKTPTTGGGNIDINTGVQFLEVEGTGSVNVNQSGAVRVDKLLSSNSSVVLRNASGDVTLVDVSAKGAASLYTEDGSILDDGQSSTLVKGGSILLDASQHLGTAGTHLATDTTQLALRSAGDIYVDNGSNLASLTIDNRHGNPGQVNVIQLDSPFLLFSVADDGNQYTLDNIDSALLGTFSFTGDQDIVVRKVRGSVTSNLTLRATSGDILDDGDSQTRITGNRVSLIADQGSLGSATHALNVNTSDLRLTTAGDLYLNSIADLGNLALTASHPDADVLHTYRITAPSLLLDLSDNLDGYRFNTLTDVTSLTFSFTGDRDLYLGDIDLTRTGSLTMTSVNGSIFDDGNAASRVLADSITLRANGGSIGSSSTPLTLVGKVIDANASAGDIDLLLAMPTNSTFNQAFFTARANNGAITLRAQQGDLLLRNVTARDAISLTAENGSIGFDSGSLSGNSVMLNAQVAIGSADKKLQLNTNGLISARAHGGDIALNNANGTFRLGEIDAGSANLYLSGNGSLVDDGDTNTRLRGAAITLDAGSTLGNADTALGLATGKLIASANGLMNLNNQGSLTDLFLTGKGSAASVSLADGNIGNFSLRNASGLYYLEDIAAQGALNFGFTANSTGIRVGHIDTKGGSASLTSTSGNITTDGSETSAHIDAQTVALKANGSIGASGDYNTLLLAGTRNLALEAGSNFYVNSNAALNNLALTVNSAAATANQFAIGGAGQTFDISDDGNFTHSVNTIGGSGLANFSFTGKKNIAVGSIVATDSVSLSTSNGSGGNAISQIAGSGISAGSVNLYTQNYSTDAAYSRIGASGNTLKVATSNLKVNTPSSFFITNSGGLNSLDLTLRHNSSASDSPAYTYSLSSTGLTFNVGDSYTTTTLSNVSQSGLNFSLNSDRAINVGTVNTGGRSSGSVSLTASGGYNSTTGMSPRINGGTITSGAVNLSAANYMGSISTSTVTNNLALSSAGNVSVSNSGNLNSLSLTANVSNTGNSASYAITAGNISQSTISYASGSVYGLNLSNFVASNLALTVNTGHTLTVGTLNTGTGGSATLTSSGTIQGQTASSRITAGAVTLNGNSVGVYADPSPLLLSTSRLSGNVANNLHVSNTGAGDLTLGNLTMTSGRIINDASILYDGAAIKATTLALEAGNGSIGSSASHMRLDVRNLTTVTGQDLYVDGLSDFYSLNVTSNHVPSGRTNVLQVTAPQLVFDITDGAGGFNLTQVSDASGLDFTFTGDRDITVAEVDGQRGRYLSLNSVGGNLISNGASLNASQVNLTATGSIGSDPAAFTTQALDLQVTAGADIYVDNTLDLSALSFWNTQSGNQDASYRITAPNLTFVASDNGSDTLIDTLTDSTGLNFTGRTNGHRLVYGTLDTSPTGVDNGGSLTLISNTGILAKDGSSHLTAANLSFVTYNNATIGANGSALQLSAPRLNLDVTGDYYLNSDDHIDELTVNTQRQNVSTVSTYQLNSVGLMYSALDATSETTLNIADTSGLRLNYNSGRGLVLGDIDLGNTGTLTLSTLNSGANIVGDGDPNHRITTGTLNLNARGAIGASGAAVRADAATVSANAQGGGVRLALSNPSAMGGVTANGDTYLDNSDGDIALGYINLNGNKLFVTNNGGSILSGSLSNVTEVTLDAQGSIGNVSAITTSAQGNGTTTLTAIARSNGRGATGSIALRETSSLVASNLSAPGGVTLTAGKALAAGTINGGSSAVSLTANEGSITGVNSSNLITGGSVALSANYTNGGTAYSIGTSGTLLNLSTKNLTLISPQNIYVSNNQTLDSLTITRKNSNYTSGGTISVQSTGLAATLSDNAITALTSAGLNFTFNANRALQIGTINVGSTGSVTLSSAGYQQDGSVTAINGSSLITAGNLDLTATNYYQSGSGYTPGSIGTSGLALRTAVSNVTAKAAGAIYLNNQGHVQLDNLSSGGALSVTTAAGGDIVLGSLTYGSGHTLTLNAAGRILAGTGSLSGNAGEIRLTAVQGIGGADAPVVIGSTGNNPVIATVTGNGNIYLQTGALTGGLTTSVANGSTNVLANGNILLESMTSGNGNISVIANGNITTGTIKAGNSAQNDVWLTANGGRVLAKNASSSIEAQGIDVQGSAGVGASGLGLNTIGRRVTVASQGGAIFLSPTKASTLAIVTSNGGAITIRAGNDLYLGNILSGGGLIDASATGNLYAGIVDAGSGVVILKGATLKDDDLDVTRVVGSIVNLEAINGIGDASRALQTTTGHLNATVTGVGNLYVDDNNTAGLRLNNVRTQNGAIDIQAAGPLAAALVTSTTDGNSIRLQNASGDLLLGAVRAGDQYGNVTLISAGNVGRLANDATNIRSHSLSITANGNIGSVTDVMTGDVDALRTQVSVLQHLDTGAQGNQVAITNAGNLLMNAGSLSVPADGKVFLRTTSGNLDARQLTAPVSGDLALLAQGVLYLPTDALVTSGNLRLEGGADILSDSATPRTLTANAGSLRLVSGSQGGVTTLNSQTTNLYVQSQANDLVVNNQGELDALRIVGTRDINFTNDLGFVANNVSTSGIGRTLNLTALDGDLTILGALQGNTLNVGLQANNGNVVLNQAASGLNNLTITASAIELVGVSSSGSQIYTGATTLSGAYAGAGNITVNGAAQLAGDTSITAGGNVHLLAIDGAHALTIANGNGTVLFGGTVGSSAPLASLAINGSGNLLLNGAVTTSGAQQYSNVLLTGDSVLTSQQAGVTFHGLANGAHDLRVISEAAGDVAFLANVGDLDRVGAIRIDTAGESYFGTTVRAASVYTDDPGTVTVGSSIDTTGNQYYGERLVLNNNVVLTGGVVTLAQGADGHHDLSIVGDADLRGTIGADQSLASLSISGTAQLDGGLIRTTGNQTYQGAVTLGADARLDTAGGNVTFVSTLDGGHDLTIDSTTGNVTFSTEVGGSERLGAISVVSDGTSRFAAPLKAASLETDAGGVLEIIGGPIDTTGMQRYGEHLTLSTDTVLKASEVVLLAGVDASSDGAQSLIIEGNATLGAVGSQNALSALSVTGNSAIKGGVTTTGEQHYSQTLVIDADTVLKASKVTLTQGVGGVTAGEQSLRIEGNAVIGGEQGGTAPLASLTVVGTTDFTGGSLVTTGEQLYQGAVTLSGDHALNSTGGSLVFGSTLDSGNRSSLTLSAGEDIVVQGAVGGTSPLGALVIDAGDSIDFASNVHVSSVQQAAAGGLTRFGGELRADGADGIVLSGDGFVFEAGVTADQGVLTVHNSDAAGTITFNGPILAKRDFTQTGGAHMYLPETITVSNGGIKLETVAEILSDKASFTTTGDIVMNGLYAPQTWLTLSSGTGALKIGLPTGNAANRNLIQVARLSVPTAGSANLFGNIGIVGGRKAAREIDSKLTRAPYFINETPWGDNEMISQVVAVTVPKTAIPTTPSVFSLFIHTHSPLGMTPDVLGAYASPKVLSVAEDFAPQAGTCVKDDENAPLLCGL